MCDVIIIVGVHCHIVKGIEKPCVASYLDDLAHKIVQAVSFVADHLAGKDGTEKDLEFDVVFVTHLFHPFQGGDTFTDDGRFIRRSRFEVLVELIYFFLHQEIIVFVRSFVFVIIIIVFGQIPLPGFQTWIPFGIVDQFLIRQFEVFKQKRSIFRNL